jgi:hypothetical protein
VITSHGRSDTATVGTSLERRIDREAQQLRRCLPYTAEGTLPPGCSVMILADRGIGFSSVVACADNKFDRDDTASLMDFYGVYIEPVS